MAGTAVSRRDTTTRHSTEREAIIQLNKVVDDLEVLRAALGASVGFLTSDPALQIGTSSAAAVRNAAFTVVVRGGDPITVAAGETAFTATTHDIADPDTDPRESYYVLSVDAAGSITITKGTTAAADAAVRPSAPSGEVVVGYVKIQHNGTAIFNATTDDLDAAHLTTTFEDGAFLSAAALTAAPIQDQTGTEITA